MCTGLAYIVPFVAVGVEPSVVKRIAAPDVTVVIVTSWAAGYDPGPGLKTGAETRGSIVYCPEVTEEVVQPVR